ncbi:MAG TPA: YihY/virulence factor BrkB family protein [Roseiflexaceae bacterium]|nr:YihY/virulence factor BrkB family protein [Roseiflexaceae bacterium]
MNLKQDLVPLLQETWQGFQEDEAGQLGAALSYYAMFSIFPLLLLLTAVIGFVLRNPDTQAAQQQILSVVATNFSPQLSQALEDVLSGVANAAGAATVVGIVTLLMGASGVFQQLDLSFNRIWKVPKAPEGAGVWYSVRTSVTQKLFSFGMVLSVGFLLLVSLALTGLTQILLNGAGNFLGFEADSMVMQTVSGLAALLVTLLLNTLIFALLFKYLPDTKIAWGDVWLGAVFTAIIWEIAKRLLAIYIGGSAYASAYGVVGTVLVLMAWIFFTSQVLYLGAEFTKAYAYRLGSRRPVPQPAEEPPPPPLVEPELPPAPAQGLIGKLAIATGAGVLLGTLGSLLAAVVALTLGARRALGLFRRNPPSPPAESAPAEEL